MEDYANVRPDGQNASGNVDVEPHIQNKIKVGDETMYGWGPQVSAGDSLITYVVVYGCEPGGGKSGVTNSQSASIGSSSSSGNAHQIRVISTRHDLEVCNTMYKHTIHHVFVLLS